MTVLSISPFFVKYIAIWASFCLVAIFILVWDGKRLYLECSEYLSFLCVPWKLCLFVPALLFVSFAGRYTNDETWDVVTGSGMAILTFLTAPWSTGLIYQVVVGRRPLRYLIVAITLLLFSSSWSYDAYLLLRDGVYTPRWAGNLMLSPFIYVAAGLLWNLEAKDSWDFRDRWEFRLSFVRTDWPKRQVDTRFGPLALVSILFIVIAALVSMSALASAVFASTGSSLTAKKLFEDAAKDVVKRSSVAVYVPVSIQSLDTAPIDGCAFSESERDSYDISIYGRVTEYGKTEPLPCEASNAAFLAGIHGDTKPMPDLSKRPSAQRVALQSGAPGWFIPVSCGGSCAHATLYWQMPKASYCLQLKLGSLVSIAVQRLELLEIANSLQVISAER
jgi:hypothetical protein